MSDEQVRREFEAWAKVSFYDLALYGGKSTTYFCNETEKAWEVWKSVRTSRQAEIDRLTIELAECKKAIEALETPDYWFDVPEWLDEAESYDSIQGYLDNADVEIGDTFEMTPIKILPRRTFRVTASEIGYEQVTADMEKSA